MRKMEEIKQEISCKSCISDDDFFTVVKLVLSTVSEAKNHFEYEETINKYTIKAKRLETIYLFLLYRRTSLIAQFDIFYMTNEFIIINYMSLESNIIAEALEKMLNFKQAFS